VATVAFSPLPLVVAASAKLSAFAKAAAGVGTKSRAGLHCAGRGGAVRGCPVEGFSGTTAAAVCASCAELDLGLLVLSLKGVVSTRPAASAPSHSHPRATEREGHVLVKLAGFETARTKGLRVRDGVYRARLERGEVAAGEGGTGHAGGGDAGSSGYTHVVVLLHVPHVHALAAVPSADWAGAPLDLSTYSGGSTGATVSFMQQEWYAQGVPLAPSQKDDWKTDSSRSDLAFSLEVAVGALVGGANSHLVAKSGWLCRVVRTSFLESVLHSSAHSLALSLFCAPLRCLQTHVCSNQLAVVCYVLLVYLSLNHTLRTCMWTSSPHVPTCAPTPHVAYCHAHVLVPHLHTWVR
jgi:hypothetical protein